MASTKFSFGHRLVSRGNPRLRFDMQQLPPTLIQRGSLDDIAVQLEMQGSGNATAIRTAALRWLGEYLISEFNTAQSAAHWLQTKDVPLAVWAACVCAQDALAEAKRSVAPALPSWEPSLRAVAYAENWCAYGGNETDARRAAQGTEDGREWSLAAACAVGTTYLSLRYKTAECAAQSAVTTYVYVTISKEGAYSDPDFRWEERMTELQRIRSAELLRILAEAMPGFPVRVR